MNAIQKQKLRKFVKELESYRGRHTELVSVYVPAGYELVKIIQHIQEEQGTAANIKDKNTRNNVIDSLEKIIRHLRLFKKTPENGLAVFAGNASLREDQTDIRVWSIEPPQPLKTRLYRCDQTFVVDLLKEMLTVKETYGLIVIDNREANIGLLRGTLITQIAEFHSQVPGKTHAGGQCEIFGTLVQLASGEIFKIENLHNPHIVKSAFFEDLSLKDSNIIDKWIVKKNKVYKITTTYPQLVNECSNDHLFYVVTPTKIIEKPAKDLKVGDYLLMPEKINIKSVRYGFDAKKYYNAFSINKQGRDLLIKKRKEYNLLQRQLAKLIGINQTIISYYEVGIRNPSRDKLFSICNHLNLNHTDFLNRYTKPSFYHGVDIKFPRELNPKLAQFLGYFMGDGNYERDRITFSEQDKQVAWYYKKEFGKFFRLNVRYRYRKSKNYHQLRFLSRPLVRFVKEEFPELKDKIAPEVPIKITTSNNKVVAKFLRGLFDAEGYVSDSMGIGSINKTLIGQVQLLLLRFSIISSFIEYDNHTNPYSKKPIFKLQITEKESIYYFRKFIGFSSFKKTKKLNNLLKNKSDKSRVRQILPFGSDIRRMIEHHGYKIGDFPKVSDFFRDNKMMSKKTFKNSILNNIKDKQLYEKLVNIYNSNLLPVKISKIEVFNKPTKMVDITVKNHNFIANGIIVHNSAQRFAALREIFAKDFYNRVAEVINREFLSIKENLKGILIGGPGPTKETFASGNYLNNELKRKVLGTKDLSYTGEFGLNELVDKSQDLLAKEEVIKEKQIVNKFFETLAKFPEKTAYGVTEVDKALEYGAVDILLVSDSVEESLLEKYEAKAQETGAKFEVISIETKEGSQLKEFGGVVAILRFALPR